MSERKINLEEILTQYTAISKIDFDEMCYKNGVIEAMLEFGKQLLELAVENVRVYADVQYDGDDREFIIAKLDKQSILNTITQVE